MMKQKRGLLQAGFYTLVWAVFFCLLFFGLGEVLRGWELHNPLFRYSADYFAGFRHEPHSLLRLCNAFLVQFAYYPLLGAVLYASLLTLLAYCWDVLIKPAGWGFPLAACALLFFPYSFAWVLLVFLFSALCGLAWKATAKAESPGKRAGFALLRILLSGCTILLLREYAALAVLLCLWVDFSFSPDFPKKWGNALLSLFVWGLWGLVAYRLWQPYCFFSEEFLFALWGTEAPPFLEIPFFFFSPSPLAVGFLFALSGISLLAAFLNLLPAVQRFFQNRAVRLVFALLALFSGISAAGLCPQICREQKVFYKCDRLCRAWQWEKAMKCLEAEYFAQAAARDNLTHARLLYSAQTKCCLLAGCKATDQLFTYNLVSFPSLFPENTANRAEAYILPVYYAYAGNYGESLHMNYDQVTGGSCSAAVLQEIIRTGLILDDTLPASKFTYLLNQTLFRGREAKKIFYRECPEIEAQIARGKTMLPPADYAVNAYVPDENAEHNYRFQTQSPYFYEYHLCNLLMRKQHIFLPAELPKIEAFYGKGKQPFYAPQHLQEALVMSRGIQPAYAPPPRNIEGIEPALWNFYGEFLRDKSQYEKGKISFAELQKKWRHTYWFYERYLVVRPNTNRE